MSGFNPRLPGGRRLDISTRDYFNGSFNPRLPGGRRRKRDQCTDRGRGFNPRLPGGRRHARLSPNEARQVVSIHAFRGEGDHRAQPLIQRACPVSIHAFRGEGDVFVRAHPPECYRFNPRLPGGRRRELTWYETFGYGVSIHAFRGEGDAALQAQIRSRAVSIHAFRGEGDVERPVKAWPRHLFQSTPSGGKATSHNGAWRPGTVRFQSTPSGGKATNLNRRIARLLGFQSTPSGGKATTPSC